MASHQLERDQLGGPAVHLLTVQRVDAVRDPHPVGVLEHLEVHAGSAGGAGFDLQSRMGGLQRVHQGVCGQGLLMHGGPAGLRGRGLQEISVVVPLEVADLVPVQDRHHLVPDMGVGARQRQVQHLLVPRFQRHPVEGGGHDPLGVGASDVGVLVDHLRLEPEPEFHAQPSHVVDQRAQAVGPDVVGDHPVAEPGGVVAAGAEPAVVQHEALHPERCGPVGEIGEPGKIVIEVDRLPDVEGDRPAGVHVLGAGTQVAVEAGGDGIEALAVGGIEPGAGVLLPGSEVQFAREQQLAAAEDPSAGVDLFGEVAMVAGEGGVDAPRLAVAEAEAGAAGVQDVGGIGTGATAAVLAQVRADGEGGALRGALLRPAAREVEQLLGILRDRDGEGQLRQRIGGLGGVGQGGAHP